ncbi:MAG TPA: hypothetical protein EYQ31_01990 [Candidatus Handelsmanbacteria bacterium]|nr:hypothetical protein [Candidatus Handelsmanbacteria bacterium]
MAKPSSSGARSGAALNVPAGKCCFLFLPSGGIYDWVSLSASDLDRIQQMPEERPLSTFEL